MIMAVIKNKRIFMESEDIFVQGENNSHTIRFHFKNADFITPEIGLKIKVNWASKPDMGSKELDVRITEQSIFADWTVDKTVLKNYGFVAFSVSCIYPDGSIVKTLLGHIFVHKAICDEIC